MLIGYARVSTKDQKFDLQIDKLKEYGCERIYKDAVSGVKARRSGLDEMLLNVRRGDSIVIWKLDRLGRSLKHLIDLTNDLTTRGVGLKSLNDPIDTTTTQGRLVFNIFSSLAEFERELIKERTNAGLAAARARGRVGGRPKGLSQESITKAIAAESMYKSREMSCKEICEQLNISRKTFYNYLDYRNCPRS